MKKNMGSADKTIRILLAIVVGILWYNGIIEGTFAYVLMTFAVIFLITSIISFCPLYALFGISTCKKPQKLNKLDSMRDTDQENRTGFIRIKDYMMKD